MLIIDQLAPNMKRKIAIIPTTRDLLSKTRGNNIAGKRRSLTDKDATNDLREPNILIILPALVLNRVLAAEFIIKSRYIPLLDKPTFCFNQAGNGTKNIEKPIKKKDVATKNRFDFLLVFLNVFFIASGESLK